MSGRLKALTGARLVERARLLGALLRVAYPISVAMAGVLPEAPLIARGPEVVLHLPKHRGALANERLTGRMRQLGKVLDLEARIEVGG